MKSYIIENARNEGITEEELHQKAIEENLIVKEVDGGWIGFDSQDELETWENQE